MARIRTIKPEFFTSEDIVSLSPLARLLYISTWCEADKEGRLMWKPGTFKLRYFPADACDINALCDEVVKSGLVVLYAEGLAYIPQFKKHQHINPRESDSSLPDPTSAAKKPTRQPRVNDASARVDDAQGGREGKGRERKGILVSTPVAPPADADAAAALRFPFMLPLVDGSMKGVTQADVDSLGASFPAVDVPQQIRSMRAWLEANPSNRKTPGGIARFVVSWLSKAQDKAVSPANRKQQETEPEWRREQRERTEAFAGPAAAKRRGSTTIIDVEPGDAFTRLVG